MLGNAELPRLRRVNKLLVRALCGLILPPIGGNYFFDFSRSHLLTLHAIYIIRIMRMNVKTILHPLLPQNADVFAEEGEDAVLAF